MTKDLVVIGAGPGGYVAAIRAAQLGMSVAVIERAEAGGTCLNRGCIPTKSLLHSSRLFSEMKSCEKFGVSAENISFDLYKMNARKNEVVGKLRGGVEFLLKSNGVELIRGSAVINAPDTVTVDDLIINAKNILIATGSVPVKPDIPGLELDGVVTSDGLLERPAIGRLAIIGGGVIGVEFASIYSALGYEVTIIEAADRILPAMDKEISQSLSMLFKKRGVTIYTGASVEQIERGDGLVCRFSHKGAEHTVSSDTVLVSVGRKANTDGLPKDILCERGIVVDEHFQTNVSGIYAVGDVINGSIQLAHAASAQGCCAVMHMAGLEPDINLSVVPSCVYTDPEIASVGITADSAKSLDIDVKTGKFAMQGLGRAMIESDERGFAKLVFDAESEVLLGAQLMCPRATDLIGELSAAIANRLTVKQLSGIIRPHPSYTEGITEAADDAEGRAIHKAPARG